jgi:pimeloyl-ACP methyl ester carboxylesterase
VPDTIAYEEFGSGSPVVLLHPAGFGPALMVPFARQLAGEGDHHRVVIPHRRGYGHSAAMALPASLDTHHDDLLRLFGLLEIEQPVVVGISGGATLALGLALRSCPEPSPSSASSPSSSSPSSSSPSSSSPSSSSLGAVLAHEPLLGPLAPQLHAAVTSRIRHMLDHRDQPGEVSLFMRSLVGVPTWDRIPPAWRDDVEAHHDATCHEAALFARFAVGPADLDLDRRVAPDLALVTTVGSLSPDIRQGAARALADGGIESRTIDGAAHLPVFETPDAYAALIRGLVPVPSATPVGKPLT